ncbi:coiled-coil domain-containing protein 69 [Corythoichthys intestinalis]|uniref:coiled-coil domain-containing protein 69 n=1 Tax=Corythoichthys intestinalis TaxID=161448 RepID=UPI0025A6016F|nr:coiled-coil domain-containing protein 69 [Corythoichthys intestinalis]
MGSGHSKEKKSKKDAGRQDGAKRTRRGKAVAEKRLASLEGQLRILKEALSAGAEMAELLKEHADEETCELVLAIVDKVKTETSARLDSVHRQQRQQTALRHQQQLNEVEQSHEEVKVQLTESFQNSENALKAEVSRLKAELEHYEHLKRRVQESTFKRDLLRNIQAHGSPGAFWESEQESLLFVIEMKSERLRELNADVRRTEQLAEEKSCVEDRLVQTSRENEDLKVRVDKSQSVLQRVCAERDDALASCERQRLLNEALTREKEQLLFKLRRYPNPGDAESRDRDVVPIVGVSK